MRMCLKSFAIKDTVGSAFWLNKLVYKLKKFSSVSTLKYFWIFHTIFLCSDDNRVSVLSFVSSCHYAGLHRRLWAWACFALLRWLSICASFPLHRVAMFHLGLLQLWTWLIIFPPCIFTCIVFMSGFANLLI